MSFLYNFITSFFSYSPNPQIIINNIPPSHFSEQIKNFKFNYEKINNRIIKNKLKEDKLKEDKLKEDKSKEEPNCINIDVVKAINDLQYIKITKKNNPLTKINSNILCYEIKNFRFNKKKNTVSLVNKSKCYDDLINELRSGNIKLRPVILKKRMNTVESTKNDILSDIRNFKFSK